MPVARPERQEPRVIAHVDMDCFYVQVEQRKNPDLRGVPTAVVQYNSWKGGGLIAVGYEARKFGVKRSMRGDEAKRVCPDIQLVQVPVARGKADLNLYRSAGSENFNFNQYDVHTLPYQYGTGLVQYLQVVAILSTKGKCERASIDEVYLDLTDTAKSMLLEAPPEVLDSIPEEALKSHVLGLSSDANKEEDVKKWLCRPDADYEEKLLACGAIIVAELRIRVLQETTFTCSAGIAHNKMLAKLASPMHKPAQQTVVPASSVPDLLASLPVKKMKQLGGKLGSSLQDDLGVNTVGDLLKFSEQKLQDHYGINTGTWLWKIARGISGEEVEDRLLPKSHGCGKTFPGPMTLKTTSAVKHWLNQLCEELSDRIQSDLDQNKRIAQTLTLHARAFKENDLEPQKKFPSKSCALRYGASKIQEDAMRLFESGLSEFLNSKNVGWGITSLAVGASKIVDIPNGTTSILKYLNGKCSSSNSSDCSDALLEEPNCAVPFISERDAETESGKLHEVPSESKVDENPRSRAPTESTFHSKGLSDKSANVKGTILRYFSGSSCSSSNQSSANKIDLNEHERMAIASELNSNPNPNLNPNNNWGFTIEEIDPSVVDELPLEIQREIRGWIHPSKRINTGKRGSTIAHYFSPARK